MNTKFLVWFAVSSITVSTLALADDAPPVKLKLRDPATATTATSAKSDPTTDPVTGMKFVFVKGGCYKMGSNKGMNDARAVHEVCVSDFYIGKFEVTQEQWEKIMGSNPSKFKECGLECPVERVSWDGAQKFIVKLNAASGKQYRLPTESEWEYAARSGGKEETWAGTNDINSLGKFAWFRDNSREVTHKVGLKKPNGLGIYDMTGNVLEWCQDWYNESYYEDSTRVNPPGADNGEEHVLRGGSFFHFHNTDVNNNYYAQELRTYYRHHFPKGSYDYYDGLRLVLPAQ